MERRRQGVCDADEAFSYRRVNIRRGPMQKYQPRWHGRPSARRRI